MPSEKKQRQSSKEVTVFQNLCHRAPPSQFPQHPVPSVLVFTHCRPLFKKLEKEPSLATLNASYISVIHIKIKHNY